MADRLLRLSPRERIFRVTSYREFERFNGSRIGHLSGFIVGGKKTKEKKIRVSPDPRWCKRIGTDIQLPEEVVEWSGYTLFGPRIHQKFLTPIAHPSPGDEHYDWRKREHDKGKWKSWGEEDPLDGWKVYGWRKEFFDYEELPC